MTSNAVREATAQAGTAQAGTAQTITTQVTQSPDAVREAVRTEYAAAARAATTGSASCCGTSDQASPNAARYYSESERAELPPGALAANLSCGNPLAVADLHEGETVLDLGSGGGGDVLLSARRVGPTGTVYGLDMTDEMLALARANAAQAGAGNVEFRNGQIEQIPLPDASVDVVISNCVINLSPDKSAVFAEMFRVLRPGGRVGVSDVVAEDNVTAPERAERGSWAACIAGALSRSEYAAGLTGAGFTDVSVTFAGQVTDGLHSAIIRATRP